VVDVVVEGVEVVSPRMPKPFVGMVVGSAKVRATEERSAAMLRNFILRCELARTNERTLKLEERNVKA
jgi:hypothetical protein